MGGSSGGAGASGGGLTGQQAAQGMGMMTQQIGQNQADSQNNILGVLARMGPPPSMNTAPAPSVGSDIMGQYKSLMRPPSVNYRTRQDAQLNPSVGQLLMQNGGG